MATPRRSARLSKLAADASAAIAKTLPANKSVSSTSRKRKAGSPAPALNPVSKEVKIRGRSTVAKKHSKANEDLKIDFIELPSTPPMTSRIRQYEPQHEESPPPLPPLPSTPTPAAAALLSEAATGSMPLPLPLLPLPDLRAKATKRPAHPKATNATIVSPSSSRIVISSTLSGTLNEEPGQQPVSPSKNHRQATSHPTSVSKTTTDNILQVACEHLVRVDPRLAPLIERNPCRVFSPEGLAEKIDPFESLCSSIISQQVSGAAAKSIKNRFIGLFSLEENRRFPTPSEVATYSIERLRTAGLSQRKAEYIQGLAEKFANGELTARMLAEAPYDELMAKLVAVRGLGQWSIEMFACFALKRMDVFSLCDLGVQRGMAAFEGRDVAKLRSSKGGKWKYMSEKEMKEISDKFRPYRSLFMWYMWRVEETDVSTLE